MAVQGPAAGGFLADMGADVIKVEPPGGESNRWYRGVRNQLPDAVVGTQFIGVNSGKRSICLDIHTEAGREVVDQLIAGADVLLSNYREPALERMRVDYEALHECHPRLIYAIANGFGHRSEPQLGLTHPATQREGNSPFPSHREGKIQKGSGQPALLRDLRGARGRAP